MVDPLANPDVVVTLTVKRYLSVTQGVMVTTGPNPDVETDLTVNTGGRARKQSNSAFEITGGNPQGNNHLDIQFQILPSDTYAAVGLVIKNLQNIPEGGPSWDDVRVGSGTANDHTVTVRDKVRVPSTAQSITYGVYVLIKPKGAVDGFPVGDVGVIDPLFTNR